MATRSTGGKGRAGGLICLLAVLLGAAGLLGCAPAFYELSSPAADLVFYNDTGFQEALAEQVYVSYWLARQEWQGRPLRPSELFLQREGQGRQPAGQEGDEEGETLQRAEDAAVLDEAFYSREARLRDAFEGASCTVVEDGTGRVYLFSGRDLSGYLTAAGWGSEAAGEYQYLLGLQFSGGGCRLVGFEAEGDEAALELQGLFLRRWQKGLFTLDDVFGLETGGGAGVEGVTFLFAVPHRLEPGTTLAYAVQWAAYQGFSDSFYVVLLAAAIAAVCLLSLLLGLKRSWALGQGVAAKLPFELALAGLWAVLPLAAECLQLTSAVLQGYTARWLEKALGIDAPVNTAVGYGLAFAATALVLGAACFFTLSLSGLFTCGPRRYLQSRSLLVWAARRFWQWLKWCWGRVTRLDLEKPVTRTLLRLLGVNFVILALCCSVWFFGILGLLVYTVLLFLLLHGRAEKLQQDYLTLLAAARRMGDGELDAQIEGDLGPFDPLKEELNRVQAGLKKAVETELRSRNMKTELITNVSHDLKTPLTAIITYVDLLKDETLAPQQRRQYVQTLEMKSQRLKRLIEDLFEVSKAASGNTVLHFDQVDLAALIKQVQFELGDKIGQCGIDFRWNLPEGRVLLRLDGQRSSRIFENLILNITKYGMPGTRAYLDLQEEGETVTVLLRNVSAQELDFDPREITERFVRGDRARNTEGSGLGLAIAKSFTELQGGQFEVVTDGDLFKVILRWPKDANEGRQDTGG